MCPCRVLNTEYSVIRTGSISLSLSPEMGKGGLGRRVVAGGAQTCINIIWDRILC